MCDFLYVVYNSARHHEQGPSEWINNYPPAIIRRVRELGLIDDTSLPRSKKVIARKLIAAIVIPGTEDMEKDYHDYWFHAKASLKGMVIGLPVALIVGGLVALCGQML